MVVLSMLLGWGVAAQSNLTQSQLEQAAYVQSCGTCHLALPAEVLPTQSWRQIIQEPSHYGQTIEPPTGAQLQLVWGYLRPNSRSTFEGESVPFRLEKSRYFKALHPDVTFVAPIRATGCIDCHPQAELGNFYTLTSEWQ